MMKNKFWNLCMLESVCQFNSKQMKLNYDLFSSELLQNNYARMPEIIEKFIIPIKYHQNTWFLGCEGI